MEFNYLISKLILIQWIVPDGSVVGISWLSVLKLIQGSFKLNNAQDLLLKFIPWKQAREMLLPFNSIVPPRTVPNVGKGICIVLNCRPATWERTFCQCLWCRASFRFEAWACGLVLDSRAIKTHFAIWRIIQIISPSNWCFAIITYTSGKPSWVVEQNQQNWWKLSCYYWTAVKKILPICYTF